MKAVETRMKYLGYRHSYLITVAKGVYAIVHLKEDGQVVYSDGKVASEEHRRAVIPCLVADRLCQSM